MSEQMRSIKLLSDPTFGQYGEIISYNEGNPAGFQIILSEPLATGWRIAVKKTTDRKLIELGRHPDSRESFEPVEGITLIAVALPETPEAVDIFLLDQPVCLYKNIWHNTFCLSEKSYLKITENNQVSSEIHVLRQNLKIVVV